MGEKPGKRRRLSFSAAVALAFVVTAAMAVLVTAGAISIVWNTRSGFAVSQSDAYFIMVVSVAIAIILAVIIGIVFANRIATPVQKISKAVEKLKEGDLSARTGLHGDDELAKLGETIDEMADAIERDRDLEQQLIGDVAHELRTPLMAIQATVEAIQDGVFPADEERMRTLSTETRRLGRLVEALLHLNRLENGTIVADRVPIDVSELVLDIAMAHQALVEDSGLLFSTDIAPTVRVEGDRDLIHQAVANLLSNAVRYSSVGDSIHIQLKRSAGYASISVKDTGIGISEENLQHVFSRFWRADEARQRTSGGLGIGLALVREVADQHRGNVTVDSELGKGSTFTINIPLGDDDISNIPPENKAERRKAAKAARRAADKIRREQEKLERGQGKARRASERRSRRDDARQSGTRVRDRQRQSVKLFGIRVPLVTKKESEDDK